MSNGDAEAHLPDTIELTLAEVRDVLKALDDAEAFAAPGTTLHEGAHQAIRLITHKLWPDLGHLLDEDEEWPFPMAEEMLRTPAAGHRLGISTGEVYDLIFSGQLDGKPNAEGLVVIAASEIERYRLARAEA